MQIEELVKKWNQYYHSMGKETPLDDLSNEAYEAEVAYGLKEVGETWEMALEIFEHPDNKGGWMSGDVVAFIKKKMENQ